MILADTSIWIDYLSGDDHRLGSLASNRRIVIHPYVVGEIALGSLHDRRGVLDELGRLPALAVAEADDVLDLIESRRLFARGLGYVDAHLLLSALDRTGTRIWTRDRRFAAIAVELGIAYRPLVS